MRKKTTSGPLLDATGMTLDEWLAKVIVPEEQRTYRIDDSHFPRDEHRDEYIKTIAKRTDTEIKALLRCFLISGGYLGNNAILIRSLYDRPPAEVEKLRSESEFLRRVFQQPWDGMHWMLDLLPDYPREALRAVSAYFLAHVQYLPDGRWHGLEDTEEIIRARYLEATHTPETLMTLTPREFEKLVAACFTRLGYSTEIGSGTRDGGVDVTASKTKGSATETILIQCKLYSDAVGVAPIRELFGVVESRRATKGILVTTSRFSADAEAFAHGVSRIELLDFAALDRLFNASFGARWPSRVDIELGRPHRAATPQS